MGDDESRREENSQVTGVISESRIAREQENDDSYNRYQLIPKSSSNRRPKQTEQSSRKVSRSRSRSRSKPPRRKQRSSTNAFLNFKRDFKQGGSRSKSRDLLRLEEQRWRRISSAGKMPHIETAKLAKQQTQQDNKNGQQNKPSSGDDSKKIENKKTEKRKERERRKRSRSNTDVDSDVDSDSATSVTDATSEDFSDRSS